jgi:Protein of unknown function (DUF1579)
MKRFVLLLFVITASQAAAEPPHSKTFDRLKSLAGSWEGTMTTSPKVPHIDGTKTNVTLRVTSMGNLLMHEMTGAGRPDDPITTIYLEGERLQLTHYCDAGNRPRMTGKVSPDGKSVEFDFLDVTGEMKHGHMHRAVFTIVDDDHHVEEWTFMMPGEKPMRARVDLRRVK